MEGLVKETKSQHLLVYIDCLTYLGCSTLLAIQTSRATNKEVVLSLCSCRFKFLVQRLKGFFCVFRPNVTITAITGHVTQLLDE